MTDPLGSYGLILVVSAAIFGPLSGWIAGRRDRHPVLWLLFGALLGPLAIGLLAVAPPGRCPLCDTPVRGWPAACSVCGGPLGARRLPWIDRRVRVPGASAAPTVASPPVRVDRPSAPEPIPLPVGRIARPRRPEHNLFPVDLEAAERPRRTAGEDAAAAGDAGVPLATAVYFGGTSSLVVGSRYVIVRDRSALRLLGPVDRDPARIALERPLARLTATAVGGRLIITENAGDRVTLAIALGALSGASGPEVEVALAAPTDEGTGSMPASR